MAYPLEATSIFSRLKSILIILTALSCCLSGSAIAAEVTPQETPAPTPLATTAGPFVSEPTVSSTSPTEFWLPSEKPSGIIRNDRIWLTYFPVPLASSSNRVPAVIFLNYLGAANNKELYGHARYFSKRGIASAVVTLPYHARRSLPDDQPVYHYMASKGEMVAQAFEQSASDVSTVVSWLIRQPGIDPNRIGAVGISLGAIVTHLTMGRDKRISAGVAMLGGGGLLDLYYHSIIPLISLHHRPITATPHDEELIRTVDPLDEAELNQPRRVLMIQGARDLFVPPHNGQILWEALGKPPIQWIDTNHLAIHLAPKSMRKTTLAFLEQAWAGKPLESIDVPPMHVPTIKAGFVFNLDSLVTPAVQWEAFKLGKRRDHMPILDANLGLSGRGPFASVAATVNQFADVGIARRLHGERYRPYVSLHIVF